MTNIKALPKRTQLPSGSYFVIFSHEREDTTLETLWPLATQCGLAVAWAGEVCS